MIRPPTAVSLDRRVTIISGAPAGGPPIERASQLGALPYVVLLSEPGMGKSTVLAQQAATVGGAFVDVRWFLDGAPGPTGIPLFLDSLDEYRADSASSVERLAAKLLHAPPPGWWLSCRSVDWREADLAVLGHATGGKPIIVAALAPLDPDEAAQILAALTPGTAVHERAQALAARAFLQNPLSLTLLAKAGAAGIAGMPATRFALFDMATTALAHEHDGRRPSARFPAVARTTAGELCALMLLATRAGIWRENSPADGLAGSTRYLATLELQLSPETVADALNTALFRRQIGGAFVPMHRTIAEFLAGGALASVAAGGHGRPRLPLARILALMSAGGRPPTDLRGVYAWTAIHLSQRGLHAEAQQLVAQDPVAVLVYGDAAALELPTRQVLWQRLTHDDPWFLASERGDTADTAIGGLAGEDLASAFADELRHPDGMSHRFIAVTEALRYGPPVASLRPILREVVLDGQRADHERTRAAEAWLAGEPDLASARLALYRACAALPSSDGHVRFRVCVAGELPSDALTDAELAELLEQYAATKEDVGTGRIWRLAKKVAAGDRSAILDRTWHVVLEANHVTGPTHEVQRVLDAILSQALLATPAPHGEAVYRWLFNLRRYASESVPVTVRDALHAWLETNQGHPGELLLAIANGAKAPAGGSPLWEFCERCGRFPPAEVAIALLDPDSNLCSELGVAPCRSMAIDLATQQAADPAIRSIVLKRLQALPRDRDLYAAIDLVQRGRPKHPVVIVHERRQAAYRAQETRRAQKIVAKFKCCAASLRGGTATALLRLAAQIRFGTDIHGAPITPGFDRVIELVGEDVAKAIEAGWIGTARGLTLTPAELGEVEAALQQYPVELVALAGVESLLATNPDDATALPLAAALVSLRTAPTSANRDQPAVERLQRWALEHLSHAGADGSAAVSAFWGAALKRGACSALSGAWMLAENPGLGKFAVRALREVLAGYPFMAHNVLDTILHAATGILSEQEMSALAKAALKRRTVKGECRKLWVCVAFALDPTSHRQSFVAAFAGCADTLSQHASLIHRIAQGYFTQRILIALGVIEACARGTAHDAFRGGSLIRNNVDGLANSDDPLARVALHVLADDPNLEGLWREHLHHALAVQAQRLRDSTFTPLAPIVIASAIAGGAPANAADLFAVVVEQLRKIQAAMQTGALNGWESYWNERPGPTPKTENRCRDILARELHAKLEPYGIATMLPEVQRAAETRVDLLFLTSNGKNLPLEAKRHWHPAVWTAAGTQLQGYAADVDAEHFGIYVVFWFGNYKPTTARSDRRHPSCAAEMEEMLVADLPEAIRLKTAVVVVDVSDPRAMKRSNAKRSIKRVK